MIKSVRAIQHTMKGARFIQNVGDWDPNLIRVLQIEGDARILLRRAKRRDAACCIPILRNQRAPPRNVRTAATPVRIRRRRMHTPCPVGARSYPPYSLLLRQLYRGGCIVHSTDWELFVGGQLKQALPARTIGSTLIGRSRHRRRVAVRFDIGGRHAPCVDPIQTQALLVRPCRPSVWPVYRSTNNKRGELCR